jgi:hypothetical protein
LLQAERQAEAITTSWPAPASAEQPPAIKLTRDLQELIAQFESFARDSHGASPGAAADISAATTRQEQLPVTIVGDSPAPPPDALGPGGVPAPPAPDAVRTSPAVLAWAADSVGDRLDPLATVRPILHRSATGSSAAWGANPTVSSSSPSGAGAALGGGANGLTAPGAALLVMAAACLLATRLLGRRTTDPTLWRSALLNLRLERPG